MINISNEFKEAILADDSINKGIEVVIDGYDEKAEDFYGVPTIKRDDINFYYGASGLTNSAKYQRVGNVYFQTRPCYNDSNPIELIGVSETIPDKPYITHTSNGNVFSINCFNDLSLMDLSSFGDDEKIAFNFNLAFAPYASTRTGSRFIIRIAALYDTQTLWWGFHMATTIQDLYVDSYTQSGIWWKDTKRISLAIPMVYNGKRLQCLQRVRISAESNDEPINGYAVAIGAIEVRTPNYDFVPQFVPAIKEGNYSDYINTYEKFPVFPADCTGINLYPGDYTNASDGKLQAWIHSEDDIEKIRFYTDEKYIYTYMMNAFDVSPVKTCKYLRLSASVFDAYPAGNSKRCSIDTLKIAIYDSGAGNEQFVDVNIHQLTQEQVIAGQRNITAVIPMNSVTRTGTEKKLCFAVQNPNAVTGSYVDAYIAINNIMIEGINAEDAPVTQPSASPLHYGRPVETLATFEEPDPSTFMFPLENQNINLESFEMTESLCSEDSLKFGLCEAATCTFSFTDKNYKLNGHTIQPYLVIGEDRLPLGKYTVDSVQNSYKYNQVTHKVEAYDDLVKLNQNAADWYTMYMYGIDLSASPTEFPSATSGFTYARQIFSAYYNYASQLGYESPALYNDRQVYGAGYVQIRDEGLQNLWHTYQFDQFGQNEWRQIRYAKINVPLDPDSNIYKVHTYNLNWFTDEEYVADGWIPDGYDDPYYRGYLKRATVLVEETREGAYTNRFLADRDDYFMVSPQCTALAVYIPIMTGINPGDGGHRLIEYAEVFSGGTIVDLNNGWCRLPYYNWETKEIFEADTSITGRDVIHSLLEPCGCFYKLDRNGVRQFKYAVKHGLFPSEKLYPSDSLHPIHEIEEMYTTGKYESMICEDYAVKDYGRIQILKQDTSNKAESVVQWQYVGNGLNDNTYIIDDNIFYCNPELIYEQESMPEVVEALQNMYAYISSVGYTPHTTKATGMPYMETGDRIVIITGTTAIESFIFRRTYSGIKALRDTFEAYGVEKNAPINNFAYSTFAQNV